MGPSRVLSWLLNLIFPPVCPICKTLLVNRGKSTIICSDCHKAIRPVHPPYCPRCGLPYPSGEEKGHFCAFCLKERRYYEVHRTCALYEGALKEAIHRFKYGGVLPLATVFGELLYSAFRNLTREYPVELLIPVPLHIKRLRARGFNQALLLARELSKRTGIPYAERALKKIKDTPFQINLKKRERRKNLRRAFQVKDQERIKGKAVMLVDDVYTTGTTVNECSRALRRAGAEGVVVLTVARAL